MKEEILTDLEQGATVKSGPRWAILYRNPILYVLLGCLVVALVYGRVVLFNINSGVIGGNIDGYENLWNDYWLRTALLQGKNPYFTNFIYYPIGTSLRFHTLHPLTAVLAIPLWPLIGSIATTNLIFLIALFLTCFCGYLLINEFVKSPLISLAAAAIFTCAHANHQGDVGFLAGGQTEKLSAQWLPLYLFFILRLVRFPAQWRRYGLLSVGALFLLTFTDWQYTLFAVLTTGLLFLYLLVVSRRGWGLVLKVTLPRLAGVGITWAAIIMVPLILPMYSEAVQNPWLNVSNEATVHSMDLLDYFAPGLTNPGYIAMLIMLVGVVAGLRYRHELAGFWLLLGGLAASLTLGSTLVVANNDTGIPLPYSLLTQVPVLSAGRDPARFYTLALLPFAILFGWGLKFLVDRRFYLWRIPRLAKKVWPAWTLVGLVTVFTLFGYVAKSGLVTASDFDVPQFYRQLGEDPTQYAILELPLFTDQGRKEAIYQAYQSVHHKWRFGGRYARDHKLANPNNFVKREAYFRDFFWLGLKERDYYRPSKDIYTMPDMARIGLPLLNYYQVHYIVVWKEAIPDPKILQAYRDLIHAALGPQAQPILTDARMEVYAVPPGQATLDKPVLDIGEGWHQAQTDQDGVYRWADPSAAQPSELYLTNPGDKPVQVKLQADLFSFVPAGTTRSRTIKLTLDDNTFAEYSFGEYGDLKKVDQTLTIPPGLHIVRFVTAEPGLPANPDPAVDNRILTFGLRNVKIDGS